MCEIVVGIPWCWWVGPKDRGCSRQALKRAAWWQTRIYCRQGGQSRRRGSAQGRAEFIAEESIGRSIVRDLAQSKRQGKQSQGHGLMLISYELREGFPNLSYSRARGRGRRAWPGGKAEQNLV